MTQEAHHADSKQAPLDAEAAAKAAFASVQNQPFPNDIFTAPELRWAVIGCGVIANQMAQSLALAGRKLAGVANRTLSKAQAFAEQYGVEKVYETVEDLYADPDIDASISPRRTTRISPICVLRLAAGKHVLCEKAITLNSAELDEPVPSPTSTTWFLWMPPRCSTCRCIRSCAVAWMRATLAV